jgi:hypothetical protein
MIKYLKFRIWLYFHCKKTKHRACQFQSTEGLVADGCYDCNKLVGRNGVEYNITPSVENKV